MKKAWNYAILICVLKILWRYTIWILFTDYMKNTFTVIETIEGIFERNLAFTGMLYDNSQIFMELLPEFFTLFVGASLKSRVNDIEYFEANKDEILGLEKSSSFALPSEEITRRISTIKRHRKASSPSRNTIMQKSEKKSEKKEEEILDFVEISDDEEEEKENRIDNREDQDNIEIDRETSEYISSFAKSIENALIKDQESPPSSRNTFYRANGTAIDQIEYLRMQYCRSVVAGYNPLLEGEQTLNSFYGWSKMVSCSGFLTAVFLSTFFKISLVMWLTLLFYFIFFWRSHGYFWDTVEKSLLDIRIKGCLSQFYSTYLSRDGLLKEEMPLEAKNQLRLEHHFFTSSKRLRIKELRYRESLCKMLQMVFIFAILLEYSSYLFEFFSDGNSVKLYLQYFYYYIGILGYSDKRIMDVYGFYVMLIFVILETFLIRKSKKLYTDILLEGENVDNFEVYKKTRSELSSRNNTNLSEKNFSVNIEDF